MQVSWLTPAEIFQPHYGRAIATSIMKKHPEQQPLNIIEVGGGSGRLAEDILVRLPEAHHRMLLCFGSAVCTRVLDSAVAAASALPRSLSKISACRIVCNNIGLPAIGTQATPHSKSAHTWHQHKLRWFSGMASTHHATKCCSRTPYPPPCGTVWTSSHVSSFSWRSLTIFLMTSEARRQCGCQT